MTTIHRVQVPAEYVGKRFDYTLSALLPQYSRMEITKWFKNGMATNEQGTPMIANKKIVAPMIIYLQAQRDHAQQWQAEKLPLDIVFQDDALLIVNKPPGMVTHPGPGNWHGTLANALLYHYPSAAELDRAGLVHRLDKDTSGLLVVAKTHEAQQN